MGGIFVESACRADVLNDRAKAVPGNDLEEHFENSYGKLARPGGDFISLTDMVRKFDGGDALIEHWLKNKDTVLFLSVRERLKSLEFNSLEFEGIGTELRGRPSCAHGPSSHCVTSQCHILSV